MADDGSRTFLTQGNEQPVQFPSTSHAPLPSSNISTQQSHTQMVSASNTQNIQPNATDMLDEINTDGEHVSQSTRLHHKMREMKEMDDRLNAMKSEYSRRINAVKDGESKFLEKQSNTIKYLRRFKAFIIETDAKRNRAEKKELEEKKQKEQKSKEIDELRSKLALLKQERDVAMRRNEQYKQNKSYLEHVLLNSDQYTEIDELRTRHLILSETNRDLSRDADRVSKKYEEIQINLQNLQKNKQNEILVQNSEFARLLKQLEDVTNHTSTIENEVGSAEGRTKDMNRYFSEVQMAIKNIRARCKATKKTKENKTIINGPVGGMIKKTKKININNNNSGNTQNNTQNNNTLNLDSSGKGGDRNNTDTVSNVSGAIANTNNNKQDNSNNSTALVPMNNNTSQQLVSQQQQSQLQSQQQHQSLLTYKVPKQQDWAVEKQKLLKKLEKIAERMEELDFIVLSCNPDALSAFWSGPAAVGGSGGGGGGNNLGQQGVGGNTSSAQTRRRKHVSNDDSNNNNNKNEYKSKQATSHMGTVLIMPNDNNTINEPLSHRSVTGNNNINNKETTTHNNNKKQTSHRPSLNMTQTTTRTSQNNNATTTDKGTVTSRMSVSSTQSQTIGGGSGGMMNNSTNMNTTRTTTTKSAIELIEEVNNEDADLLEESDDNLAHSLGGSNTSQSKTKA